MTDFRELCAELVYLNEVEVDDWTRKWADAVNRTKAALDQPEPQGPTNEELTWLWNHLQVSRRQLMALRGENCLDDTDYQQFARSVLKQWGCPKPPSRKEQSIALIDLIQGNKKAWELLDLDVVRHALEQLND